MAHTLETKLKISEAMRGNQNANKEELSLPAAILMLEHGIQLTEENEDIIFIGQLCKIMGTDRYKLHRLIAEKFPDELKDLTERLKGNLESNLVMAAALKKVEIRLAMPLLKAFFEVDWNKADKKEITTNQTTRFVFEEKILIPEGKSISYIDITPKPKQLPEYEEDTDEIDSF